MSCGLTWALLCFGTETFHANIASGLSNMVLKRTELIYHLGKGGEVSPVVLRDHSGPVCGWLGTWQLMIDAVLGTNSTHKRQVFAAF